MKQLFLIFSLLLVTVSAGPRFDDQLRELIENIRQQMPCGFPTIGIPPLAPYIKQFKDFDLNNRGVDLAGNLSNLVVSGLNDFEVKELTFSTVLLKLKFDVNFKQIKSFGQYNAKGGFNLLGKPFPLQGNGNLDFLIENLRINGSFRVRPTTSNGLKVWDFKTSVQVDGVQSKTTGIMNSQAYSTFFNRWVEEFFRILVQDYQDQIGKRVGSMIVPIVNDMIKDVSMIELFGLVLGLSSSGGGIFPVCEVN